MSLDTSSPSENHMERVLYNVHREVCWVCLRHSSSFFRSLLEQCLCVLAVGVFGTLVCVHMAFVYREVSMNNVGSSAAMESPIPNSHIPLACLQSIEGFHKDVDITHVLLTEGPASFAHGVSLEASPEEEQPSFTCSLLDAQTSNDEQMNKSEMSIKRNLLCLAPDIQFTYTQHKSHAFLDPRLAMHHGVPMQFVVVSKTDVNCFGEPFLQKLVFGLFGPENVMINWLLPLHNTTGFLYHRSSDTLIDLHHHQTRTKRQQQYHPLLTKLGTVIKTSFLVFVTTTLVSFTLRETQEKMLDFTVQLRSYVEARRSLVHLVGTHMIQNLVFVPIMIGMVFFLIEFYNGDKVLAFLVMSVVWVCESYSVICIRSPHGRRFFPGAFFLLFALFHIYFFSFPFGFSHAAMAVTVAFMAHCMLFFWNRYELAAAVVGEVSRVPQDTDQVLNSTPSTSSSILPNPDTLLSDYAPQLEQHSSTYSMNATDNDSPRSEVNHEPQEDNSLLLPHPSSPSSLSPQQLAPLSASTNTAHLSQVSTYGSNHWLLSNS